MQVPPFQNPGDAKAHWYCNMLCDTMRPETGSASKTSPSSHTNPFSLTANCWNQGGSSTRKPKRGDELTLHPLLQWLPKHPPPMPIHTLLTSAPPRSTVLCLQWLQSHHCLMQKRKTEDSDSPATLQGEVTRIPREVQAGRKDTIPAGLQANIHTATITQAVAPPTGLPIALPIACHPPSLTISIASNPHQVLPG